MQTPPTPLAQPAAPADSPPPPPSVEQRIQQATIEVASRFGIARLSMGDVARQAGLSRQTLYRHFPSREVLVEHAVVTEAAAMLLSAVRAMEAETDPQRGLAEAIATTLRCAREHALLGRLLLSEPQSLLPLVTHGQGRLAKLSREVVASMLTDRFPLAQPAAIARTAELTTRLLVSYGIAPTDETPHAIAVFLTPALLAALAGGAP